MNQYGRRSSGSTHGQPPTLARTASSLRHANNCAQCGEPIYMPEWSEWLDAACARHLWRCEACDYSFETKVYFAAA